MDYTPISARRVLAAFGITAFVALLPALYVGLRSRHTGPLALLTGNEDGYRGVVLGAGSVVLTALLIGACMLTVAIGRRMVRRPSRA